MQDFIYFLGRFHVLALHLPIGIILVAVAVDWVARGERYRGLAAVAPFLWGAAASSAVLTVVLGYMHFAEGAFTGPAASSHRFFGTTVAVASVLIFWLSRRPDLYKRVNVVTGIAAVALVAVTGHFGGDLTHGEAFLWEYAPGPLRALAGVGERRPAPPSVAAADPYLDVVQPMLQRRCGGCHNSDKLESGFSVATYDSTLKGGDSGRAIVSGKSGSSELYRRINLPRDDEEKMPAEGKTPLTEAQVEIVRWWIDAGTPHDVSAGTVGVDASVEPLLAAELGIGGSASPADAEAAPTVSADPALVAGLYAAGFLARQVSQTDAHLSVSVYSSGAQIGTDQVAALLAAADQIVELNLEDAGIDDAIAASLGKLTAVTQLRLSRNGLTDRGVAQLASLPRLEHLNLYGNAGVTDASVDTLVAVPLLRRLDVWETGITDAGIASLRQRRPDLAVQGAADAAIAGAASAAQAAPAGTK
jgi:mono/diheme cytochrome c family protein/uncharacterized membrane protein